MKTLTCILLLFVATVAFAAPSRNDAMLFVNDIEAAVAASDKVLKARDTQQLQNHSKRMNAFKTRVNVTSECIMAASSAQGLWQQKLLHFQNPKSDDNVWIKRKLEDYRDNMKFCRDSLVTLK